MGTATPGLDIKVKLRSPTGDDHRVDELARELMDEVRQLDVKGVKPAPGGPLPNGAKGTASEIGAFIVQIGGPVLAPLMGVLQAFITRPSTAGTTLDLELESSGKKKVTLKLDPKMSAEDQRKMIKEVRATLESVGKD